MGTLRLPDRLAHMGNAAKPRDRPRKSAIDAENGQAQTRRMETDAKQFSPKSTASTNPSPIK